MRRFTGSPTLLWMVWRRCLGSWSRGRSVGAEWAAQREPPPAQGLRGATAPFSLEAAPRAAAKKVLLPGVPSCSSPNPAPKGSRSACFHLSLTTPLQEAGVREGVQLV